MATRAEGAEGVSHHVYSLDGGGYDRSRATHGVLCDLRDGLKATPDNPVSDVVIFACGRQQSSLPAQLFDELERQRPAGANALYVAVEWPSFISLQPAVPMEETGKAQFERLMSDIRATFVSGDSDVNADVIDNLTVKCERYMEDVDRLVKYGKKGDERFPSDLRGQLVQVIQAFGRQGSRNVTESSGIGADMEPHIDGGRPRCGELTSIRVDDLQRTALKSTEIEESVTKCMSYCSASESSADTKPAAHRNTERHWLVLCRVIATAISRALERRAAVVGQRGIHLLLCDLMRHASNETRFHLTSHSFGVHAVLSSTLGASLPRRVHTLYIAQGSCDSKIVAARNPYLPLAKGWCPVSGPLLSVTAPRSMLCNHITLDDTESLSHRGWRSVRHISFMVERDEQTKAHYKPGVFYTLNASHLVESGDVCSNAQLVALFWEAAMTRLTVDSYNPVDPAKLPNKYWSSYRSRTRRRFSLPCFN